MTTNLHTEINEKLLKLCCKNRYTRVKYSNKCKDQQIHNDKIYKIFNVYL